MKARRKPSLRLFLPRSFLGRTALMIILPLLVFQISVSVLIVQRYYGRVTDQLTTAVIQNINYLESEAASEESFKATLRKFRYFPIDLASRDVSPLTWIDLSGKNIADNFRTAYGDEVDVYNAGNARIAVTIPSKFGDQNLLIARDLLSPQNPHQMLFNSLGFVVIILAIVFWFLRSQVRSIRRLARAAEAFGRGETIPYTPSGADEIRQAGRNFIKMRERITRQREQRNLLLSGISHDLRTPLTRFRLETELIDDPETRKALLKDIEDMDTLINSFLAYAQGDAVEEFKRVSLPKFLQEIADIEPKAEPADIPNIDVKIRPQMMRRVFINLIENAKRFGDEICISGKLIGKDVQIFVDDNGPGIPEADRAKALLAFQSLDQARNQNKGAHAGLGLAIAADILRIHGGELRLEDSPMGGLRAVLQLPTRN